MKKSFRFAKRNLKAVVTFMMVAILAVFSSISCFATDGTSTDLSSSFSGALTTIQGDIMNFIGLALPVGLAVFGTIVAIKKGISFVRGLIGK